MDTFEKLQQLSISFCHVCLFVCLLFLSIVFNGLGFDSRAFFSPLKGALSKESLQDLSESLKLCYSQKWKQFFYRHDAPKPADTPSSSNLRTYQSNYTACFFKQMSLIQFYFYRHVQLNSSAEKVVRVSLISQGALAENNIPIVAKKSWNTTGQTGEWPQQKTWNKWLMETHTHNTATRLLMGTDRQGGDVPKVNV